MNKVVTLRLSAEEYKRIATVAELEHRPISNFITATVLKDIEASYFADSVEMAQIRSDKKLMERLASGHRDAKKRKGRFVE